MAKSKSDYRLGRIVWAYLRPSKPGSKALHPAIIISPNSEIVQPEAFDPRADLTKENVVAVVGVSTSYKKFPDFSHFVLPSHPTRHPGTKLTKDCAAMIGWYDIVAIPDEVEDMAGDVPPDLMLTIESAVRDDLVKKLGTSVTVLGQAIANLASRTS